MNIDGRHYRTLWPTAAGAVRVIDQTRLPFELRLVDLESLEDAAHAIRTMIVRGAPLIGATAAYGLALALRAAPTDAHLDEAMRTLAATRPTAQDLRWALERTRRAALAARPSERAAAAWREAAAICEESVAQCAAIGAHGLALLRALAQRRTRTLQVLTHCNAGWLACIDWGTALAPIYRAHDEGVALHVWVDETRPRNQGAALTAFELASHGVPHTLIADNAGGLMMRRGQVDVVIVGSDRVTASGEVCNKVGTYLKALAAHDNEVPFYAAFPTSTIDWSLDHGSDIPIEERAAREVTHVTGRTASGQIDTVQIAPDASPAFNPAFDVTPARLVTGLITEHGVHAASRTGLAPLAQAAGAR